MSDEFSSPSPSVVVSTDATFAARARTWSAAVGTEALTLAPDAQLRRHWVRAPWIVVDVAAAGALRGLGLPRRDHVFLHAGSAEIVWADAIALGVQEVLSGDDGSIVDVLARAVDQRGEAVVISVMGACGGVGASTFAAALAIQVAHDGLQAALVDGDSEGGGIDLVLGAEHVAGMRWHELAEARGHVAVEDLRAVLPNHKGVDLVTFDRRAEGSVAGTNVLASLVRGFDLVVADVPRQLSDLGDELLSRSILTVVLLPRQLVGVVRAERLLSRLEHLSGNVALVTTPGNKSLTAQDVTGRLRLPVLAEFPRRRSIDLNVEHGLGPRRNSVHGTVAAVLGAVGLS